MYHDVCETMGGGFVDLVVIPFAVLGQRKAMSQRSLLWCNLSSRGSVSSEWYISGSGVPNIVFEPGFGPIIVFGQEVSMDV